MKELERLSILGLLTLCLGLLAGCGGSAPDSGTSVRAAPQGCEPGKADACSCDSGASGAQVCVADGSGWGACDCGTGDSGTAGASPGLTKQIVDPSRYCMAPLPEHIAQEMAACTIKNVQPWESCVFPSNFSPANCAQSTSPGWGYVWCCIG